MSDGQLVEVTAAGSLPVDEDLAKQRLRIDGAGDDADLLFLIGAATKAVEEQTGLVLQQSEWEYRIDSWRSVVCVPIAPVRVVSEVVYLDVNGNEQSVDSDDWYWDRTPEGATVRFVAGFARPTLFDRPGSVRIRLEAGYDNPDASGSGDDPALVLPPTAEMAVLFLVGHWFENREPVIVGQGVQNVPKAFDYLAAQLRIYR